MADQNAVRIVFMGTPMFAVPSLRTLLDLNSLNSRQAQVVGVFTQPDRPSGRGRRLAAPPVKELAIAAGVPVYQPERLRRPEGMAALEALAPDLIVVAAYAQILSQAVLDLPRYGCLNVHASLLPRYRGAAPIQAAILDGAPETGISIMQMEAGLDTGPVLSQVHVAIAPDDTAESLSARLADEGARLLARTVPDWISGAVSVQPQDESAATMTRPLRKEDGLVDWHRSAVYIERQVRAMYPWPGAYTTANGTVFKILAAEPRQAGAGQAPPGTLLVEGAEPVVATGEGTLLLRRVQSAGRMAMSGADWLRGASSLQGTVLGMT